MKIRNWVFKEPWADWPEEEQLEYFRLEQQGTQRARELEAQKQKTKAQALSRWYSPRMWG